MSDDEYIYDEEYDDFEGDIFWNEEGEIVPAVWLSDHVDWHEEAASLTRYSG